MTTLFDQPPTFPGKTFNAALDAKRLQSQAGVIFSLMRDGQWYSLKAIENATGFPQASISARLRDTCRWCSANGLGRWEMCSKRQGQGGTWVYRVLAIDDSTPSPLPGRE